MTEIVLAVLVLATLTAAAVYCNAGRRPSRPGSVFSPPSHVDQVRPSIYDQDHDFLARELEMREGRSDASIADEASMRNFAEWQRIHGRREHPTSGDRWAS